MAEVDSSAADESLAQSEAQDEQPSHTTVSATVGTRRQANGTIGSVYSGNKIRHLKKEDGIPLWRKDIQYQFLKLVFEDRTPVFTRLSDGRKGMDFADIYIDAMAKSSKTSKILKDKLQNDKQAAISMAMVCLLVNFGRMNTTLNFFPEMRAQLRTYHSIPSLQAHQDPNAYKQLQDAPRLKSILKGASEDTDQPNTIEKIKRVPVPRTNPVNLIFVLSQYAPKISETHFFAPRDFFDLVMRATLSSKSRARAFLWLMWWYLESDFTREAALNNPFGPGLEGEGTGGLPIKVPAFESLTEEQADAENVDTPEEIQYGQEKQLERKRILEEDEPIPRATKRSRKGAADYSFEDDQASGDLSGRADRVSLGGRSAMSTPLHPSSRRLDDEEDYRTPGSARGRYKRVKRESLPVSAAQQRLIIKTKMDQTPDTASPAPPGSGHPILNQFVTESAITPQHTPGRRPRPLTQHQLAVEQNRRQRIDYLLAQRKNEAYKALRVKREAEIPMARYCRLLQGLPDGYDTEDENSWGKGGLLPNPAEEDDFGEAASFFLSVIRKANRRLDRWDWEEANGPRKDRKKEREERHKSQLNGYTVVDPSDARPGSPSRGRGGRTSRARRKPVASTNTTPRRNGLAASRSKGGRSRTSRAGLAVATAKDGLEAPSPLRQELSPMPTASVDEDVEREGEEVLDEVDKELAGEEGGEPAPSSSRAHLAPGDEDQGYEDSFIEGGEGEAEADVDEDADALSTDNEDDEEQEEAEDEDVEEGEGNGEENENESNYGGNGYAASESSEPEADVEGEAEGEAEVEVEGDEAGEGDDDETMEDQ
ncbi:hypothetical protein DTO166G4_7083 [Paecilomyces variotii]|nr:hypothetical protein DTO166G4_7083 [Paecilomyces variotii]KAJ9238713.1 hypothetical protein DTO166G5_2834 [Paecilomyces variotii]KAJ9248257.1 hypothetical protein DTO207G8_7559 [Paecilomyces variotii]KAJ9378004.1 hypothetical protein DTO063F5_7891 [Paecilomyces variotii]